MTEKRYELYNKYNHNEIIQDNYNVLDGCVQIYSAETVEFELNDLFNRLKNIREICNDCLKELSGCEGISDACCGHGNDEDAYILLKDGRRFILDRRLSDDD